ncbi:hypothetical protein EVAR_50237_1 [Eumeta japonica]|uniref:Peptidase A2 domain-containing protein n=1 Tax=Eumeta variegata TaxID=151549 RepID=A0A4C2A8D5_EUMVA|nr:hypothetical protein EVAR_50237_1 [Eumeta japonica]
MQFLVDTGSELCVFHARPCNSDVQGLPQLSAANGTTINTGYVNLELNLSLRRAYPWRFVVADVTKPIIGADFPVLQSNGGYQKPPLNRQHHNSFYIGVRCNIIQHDIFSENTAR